MSSVSLPNLARFKRWYAYASTSAVYSQPSSIAVSRSYSGSVSENRTASMKPPNAQSPFAQHRHYPLLEDVKSIPAGTLLPDRRSYGLIRQSHLALLASAIGLVQEVFAGCYQPLLPTGSSRRYLCESFLGCLVPCDGGTTKCIYLFLPPCHRPSP
jgi:hypothetical protein